MPRDRAGGKGYVLPTELLSLSCLESDMWFSHPVPPAEFLPYLRYFMDSPQKLLGWGWGRFLIPLSPRLNIKLIRFPPHPNPVTFKPPFGHTSRPKTGGANDLIYTCVKSGAALRSLRVPNQG